MAMSRIKKRKRFHTFVLAQECVKPFSFFYMAKPVTETKRSGVEVHKAHCHCVRNEIIGNLKKSLSFAQIVLTKDTNYCMVLSKKVKNGREIGMKKFKRTVSLLMALILIGISGSEMVSVKVKAADSTVKIFIGDSKTPRHHRAVELGTETEELSFSLKGEKVKSSSWQMHIIIRLTGVQIMMRQDMNIKRKSMIIL